MNGLRSIVGLSRESLRGVSPGDVADPAPEFLWVDPKTLFVEDGYQRVVSEAGTSMIRHIYSQFSWSRFKPPICVRIAEWDNVLVCIDGQHTAIAAASHPKLQLIPVMVVAAAAAEQRASAFVGHNRDRLSLTPQMIYRGELAAGDPAAAAVDRVCKASGAFVLEKAISLRDKQPIGATVAIGTLKVLIKRRGEAEVVDALRILVEAGRGPIKADEIAAVSLVLADSDHIGERAVLAKRLVELIRSKTPEAWAAQGANICVTRGGKLSSGIAAAWLREMDLRIIRKKAGVPLRAPVREEPVVAKPEPQPKPKRQPPPKPYPATALKPIVALTPPAPKPFAAPPPPPPKPAPEKVVRNGIVFDTGTGIIEHAGSAVRIVDEDTTAALAALIRVSPALLGDERLIAKVFGHVGDGVYRLRALIDAANPLLVRVNLKIRSVKNIGTSISPA